MQRARDDAVALAFLRLAQVYQGHVLIAQRGLARPGMEIFMDNGYRLCRIAPTRLVEASHSFEQFCFDILNA